MGVGNNLHPVTDQPLVAATSRTLRDRWLLAGGEEGTPPDWASFDPLQVPQILPDVVVVDVGWSPLRFRYRVVGTRIADIAGRDATGRWLDESLYGDNLEVMLWTYRRCAETAAPLATVGRVHFANKEWITLAHLFLPYSRYGEGLDTILSSVVILERDDRMWAMDPRSEIILDWRA